MWFIIQNVKGSSIRVTGKTPTVSVYGGSMIRCFLALTLFTVATVSGQAPPSLPSSFQAKTIHSTAGADIFVRSGGSGPVVVLIHGYAENSQIESSTTPKKFGKPGWPRHLY